MNLIFYLSIFILGICVGSFLDCVIYRLRSPARSSATSMLPGNVKLWSFCPKCKHKLGFFDLIPILSFIILKGKCRYCGEKISWQYPIVEIATGILFVLVTLSVSEGSRGIITGSFAEPVLSGSEVLRTTAELSIFNFKILINLVYLFIVSSFLIIIFVYDFKHYIIPDKVIYPAIGVVFIYRLFEILNFSHLDLFRNLKLEIRNSAALGYTLIAALAVAGFFFMIWFFSSGRYMGFGDVKLGFLIGLFLGFPNILAALFLAFFIGAIIGLILIAFGKKSLKSQVPFGPFLVTGTFIALFWGREIINWYISLLT